MYIVCVYAFILFRSDKGSGCPSTVIIIAGAEPSARADASPHNWPKKYEQLRLRLLKSRLKSQKPNSGFDSWHLIGTMWLKLKTILQLVTGRKLTICISKYDNRLATDSMKASCAVNLT